MSSSSSSSVQQLQLQYAAGWSSFLDPKNNSSSNSSSSCITTPCYRWSSTRRRSLLLCVCMHSQLHYTHQQLLQYPTLLLLSPRAHRIETEAPVRDHGNFPGGQREKLWWEFFLDPSQWWDRRPEKTNERYPDFKHKKTKETLWLKD